MLNALRSFLLEEALIQNEGTLCNNDALVVTTGNRTGRSPKDRFIVCNTITEETVDWNDINQKITPTDFEKLWTKATDYLASKKTYNNTFLACHHPSYQTAIHTTTEYAWHMLFLTNLLVHTTLDYQDTWKLIAAPTLKLDSSIDPSNTDGIVALDFINKKILIIGIEYAGEIKKSIFSAMNYWLPEQNVLSMHCAANEGRDKKVSLFFGLSGTGKTTLSADTERFLIGDDEHGWSNDGIFNIENGCYAKCFGLSYEKEPIIFNAIKKYTVLENIILSDTQEPLYNDASLTLNTRAAYPIDSIIPRAQEPRGQNPSFIFMLSCDLFGVLPALSKLTPEQTLFWFLNGYTAHMGSTEYGESGIKPTFSTCFGAPFFPRNPGVYAQLLEEKLTKNIDVYLVNTGYFGGTFQQKGQRYPLHLTRKLIDSVHNNIRHEIPFTEGPFGLSIPELTIEEFTLKHPMHYWDEPESYISTKNTLQDAVLNHFHSLHITEQLRERILEKGFLQTH